MKRRDFVKNTIVASGAGAMIPITALAGEEVAKDAACPQAERVCQLLTKKPGAPDYLDRLPLKETDMDGIGPDGKPVPGCRAAGTGSTPKFNSHDPSLKPHMMKRTDTWQADGIDKQRAGAIFT